MATVIKVKNLCTTNTLTAKRGCKRGCTRRNSYELMKLKQNGIRATVKR
jgi:hypothetical protein